MSVPVYGLPCYDKRIALQIRSSNSFSPLLLSREQPAGDLSPYCAGDFFELPVSNALRAIILVRVYFLFASPDTTTGTWLVSFPILSLVY